MRIVIFGASGNIGTSLLEALGRRDPDADVVAVARRLPPPAARQQESRVSWRAADIAGDPLDGIVAGADVVVNLAWLFHPSHDPQQTWHSNVHGALRVVAAVRRAEVPALVVSSSIAAYSARRDRSPIDESYPTHGASPAPYVREKTYIERVLDAFEATSHCRVVRLRPAFVFHRRAATQQRRLFAGPFVPGSLLRPELLPLLPVPRGLVLQAVHSNDVGEAFASAAVGDGRGAFNICADGALDPADLGRLFHARTVEISPRVAGAALWASWAAHLVPAHPYLYDALMRLPVMSNERAREVLDWRPTLSVEDSILEFLRGARRGADYPTAPLARETSGPARVHEIATGVGAQEN
jgi:nucleoside-diphosphate-sugar epimerase